jgi:hypothetical protein
VRGGNGCIVPRFLTSVLDGGEWSVWRSGHFISGQIQWAGGYVDSRACADVLVNRIAFYYCQQWNSDHQPVFCHHTLPQCVLLSRHARAAAVLQTPQTLWTAKRTNTLWSFSLLQSVRIRPVYCQVLRILLGHKHLFQNETHSIYSYFLRNITVTCQLDIAFEIKISVNKSDIARWWVYGLYPSSEG